jgi:hypothetical protein
MPEYSVSVDVTLQVTYTIEAENFEEAEDIAFARVEIDHDMGGQHVTDYNVYITDSKRLP